MIDAPAPSRAKAVTPERLRRFLTEHGFSELGTWGRFLERYQLKRDRPIDILVPTTLDIDDYARRIQDAIAELSGAFETPVGDIINELLSVEYQTFKIRAHPNEELASIPFSEGLGLLESSKELIRASAVSALGGGFRPIIRGRLPTVVDDFMDRVEIGQTEIGS